MIQHKIFISLSPLCAAEEPGRKGYVCYGRPYLEKAV